MVTNPSLASRSTDSRITFASGLLSAPVSRLRRQQTLDKCSGGHTYDSWRSLATELPKTAHRLNLRALRRRVFGISGPNGSDENLRQL